MLDGCLTLDGLAFSLKEQVHSLGILLDSNLLLSGQEAFAQLQPAQPYMSQSDLPRVVHTLVLSHLDFSKMLTLKTVWKLKQVQNDVTQVVIGARQFDSCQVNASVTALAASSFLGPITDADFNLQSTVWPGTGVHLGSATTIQSGLD